MRQQMVLLWSWWQHHFWLMILVPLVMSEAIFSKLIHASSSYSVYLWCKNFWVNLSTQSNKKYI